MLLDVKGSATCIVFRQPLLVFPSISPTRCSPIQAKGVLTATSAQSVRLVVALSER